MSYCFPKYGPTTGSILDSDEFNEMIAQYAWQANRLTGHNFGPSALQGLQDEGDVEDELYMKTWITRYNSSGTGSGVAPTASGVELEADIDWRRVLTKTVVSRGGVALIIGKMQVSNNDDGLPEHPGVQVCLGVDNEARLESIVGGADPSNDKLDRPAVRYSSPITLDGYVHTGSASVDSAYTGTGPSIHSAYLGVRCQLVAYLAPGTHVIDLRYRTTHGHSGDWGGKFTQAALFTFDFWSVP